MIIPSICHCERIWWEQIGEYQLQERRVQDRNVKFVVEKTTQGFTHPCKVEDLCRILNLVPKQDWEGLEAFLLRQPTRKEVLLEPVWGRLAYSSDIGRPGKPNTYSGPLLILEAQESPKILKWDKSLSPADIQELDRLRADGHVIKDCGKSFLISSNTEAERATQLYRTVLHEIGHWVDWLNCVERPSQIDSNHLTDLIDTYWARSGEEKEVFAHRYAEDMLSKLKAKAKIPFD